MTQSFLKRAVDNTANVGVVTSFVVDCNTQSVMLRNTEAGRRRNGRSCVKWVVKELPCEAVDLMPVF